MQGNLLWSWIYRLSSSSGKYQNRASPTQCQVRGQGLGGRGVSPGLVGQAETCSSEECLGQGKTCTVQAVSLVSLAARTASSNQLDCRELAFGGGGYCRRL